MKSKEIKIKQIEKKDFSKAMKFTEEGMHLSWYVSNKTALYYYSKYVLYLELSKSTTVLGAYLDDKLVGFLFAKFKNEKIVFNQFRYKAYCGIFTVLMKLIGADNASNVYDTVNKKMLKNFMSNNPDGEITFFAVDSKIKGKGIGTLLLNELEKRNKNKLIYLFSDSGSTYQFYLHRGFEESGKEEIVVPSDKGKDVPLTCFLFSKKL